MPLRHILAPLVVAVASTLGGGCAPEIGDSCESSVDCSVNGDRICDIAAPGGYCTVANCEDGTCPDDSICVEYRFSRERLASSWCMAPCDEDGDCRAGYLCARADDIVGNDDVPIARVLDESRASSRFCVAEAE